MVAKYIADNSLEKVGYLSSVAVRLAEKREIDIFVESIPLCAILLE